MTTNKNGKPIVLNGVGSLVLKQVRDGKVEVIKCGTLPCYRDWETIEIGRAHV